MWTREHEICSTDFPILLCEKKSDGATCIQSCQTNPKKTVWTLVHHGDLTRCGVWNVWTDCYVYMFTICLDIYTWCIYNMFSCFMLVFCGVYAYMSCPYVFTSRFGANLFMFWILIWRDPCMTIRRWWRASFWTRLEQALQISPWCVAQPPQAVGPNFVEKWVDWKNESFL